MGRTLAVRGAIFALAAAVTSIFFIQFCATVFQCGCQALWGDAAKHCNIHAAHGKHCPWCVYGSTGYAIVYGSMLAAQLAASFAPYTSCWGIRLGTAVGVFPLSGAILALIFGAISGYWN